jgi:FkbM family methyltransferase
MSRFRDILTPASRIRYLLWRGLHARRPITLTLRTGPRFVLRPRPATDYGVAYEIFFNAIYEWPADEPRPDRYLARIVDIGSNVGYTIVEWARRFPNAAIEAFEPHPEHVSQIKQHIGLNAIRSRVTLHEAAAGTRTQDAFLGDAGSSSFVAAQRPLNGFPIRVLDFFDTISRNPGAIDLLKLDAEGAEYALMADPRFDTLDVRAIVMEWHARPDRADGGEWCTRRLSSLGYRTRIVSRDPTNEGGLLWAFRSRRWP